MPEIINNSRSQGFSSKELAEDAFNEVKSALEKEFKDDTGVMDQHEPAPLVAKKNQTACGRILTNKKLRLLIAKRM